MSLDKAIQYGKEKRKQYYGAKAIDKTCRCNGTCLYCKASRLRNYRKADINYKEQIVELKRVKNELKRVKICREYPSGLRGQFAKLLGLCYALT